MNDKTISDDADFVATLRAMFRYAVSREHQIRSVGNCDESTPEGMTNYVHAARWGGSAWKIGELFNAQVADFNAGESPLSAAGMAELARGPVTLTGLNEAEKLERDRMQRESVDRLTRGIDTALSRFDDTDRVQRRLRAVFNAQPGFAHRQSTLLALKGVGERKGRDALRALESRGVLRKVRLVGSSGHYLCWELNLS